MLLLQKCAGERGLSKRQEQWLRERRDQLIRVYNMHVFERGREEAEGATGWVKRRNENQGTAAVVTAAQ